MWYLLQVWHLFVFDLIYRVIYVYHSPWASYFLISIPNAIYQELANSLRLKHIEELYFSVTARSKHERASETFEQTIYFIVKVQYFLVVFIYLPNTLQSCDSCTNHATSVCHNMYIPPNSQMDILQMIILQRLLKGQLYRIFKTLQKDHCSQRR